MIKTITIIGAGNLATCVGTALYEAGINILQVYSRTEQSASQLALRLNTSYTVKPEEIRVDCDLMIVAIRDDATVKLLDQLDLKDTFVVHTAGSVPMDLLSNYSSSYGVFYPLQTFSKARELDFSEIPFCLEACSEKELNLLKELASKISDNIYEISSDERKVLHLAAVFICNFVNHFYYFGDQLVSDKQLSFDLLKPLIKETAAKVMELKPLEAQTGPAVRFDETIINKHLKMLEGNEELHKIYSFVSESIYRTHK